MAVTVAATHLVITEERLLNLLPTTAYRNTIAGPDFGWRVRVWEVHRDPRETTGEFGLGPCWGWKDTVGPVYGGSCEV